MLAAALAPIPGHSVFLLLIQVALLLLVARLGAALARVFGLPAVVGELLAGIVLGPSVFGHFAPGAFAAIFPQEELPEKWSAYTQMEVDWYAARK